MNTSKRITDTRKEKEWSQTDLANESGVSREMIGKYERGEAAPSIDAAKKIADKNPEVLLFFSNSNTFSTTVHLFLPLCWNLIAR